MCEKVVLCLQRCSLEAVLHAVGGKWSVFLFSYEVLPLHVFEVRSCSLTSCHRATSAASRLLSHTRRLLLLLWACSTVENVCISWMTASRHPCSRGARWAQLNASVLQLPLYFLNKKKWKCDQQGYKKQKSTPDKVKGRIFDDEISTDSIFWQFSYDLVVDKNCLFWFWTSGSTGIFKMFVDVVLSTHGVFFHIIYQRTRKRVAVRSLEHPLLVRGDINAS